jgi:hypothetical protein
MRRGDVSDDPDEESDLVNNEGEIRYSCSCAVKNRYHDVEGDVSTHQEGNDSDATLEGGDSDGNEFSLITVFKDKVKEFIRKSSIVKKKWNDELDQLSLPSILKTRNFLLNVFSFLRLFLERN